MITQATRISASDIPRWSVTTNRSARRIYGLVTRPVSAMEIVVRAPAVELVMV